jgi:hypothetical protein
VAYLALAAKTAQSALMAQVDFLALAAHQDLVDVLVSADPVYLASAAFLDLAA